jgi:hypothetical protein
MFRDNECLYKYGNDEETKRLSDFMIEITYTKVYMLLEQLIVLIQ